MFERLKNRLTGKSPVTDLAAQPGERLRQDGDALLASGNLDGAELCYRQAVASDPRNAASRVGLGRALAQLQRDDAAWRELEAAIGLDARQADAHELLASLAERQSDWRTAARHYRTAFELKPESALACLGAFRMLMLLGEMADARAFLAQGVALHPTVADFHFYEGNMLLAGGDAEWAIDSYQRALELGADHAALHGRMGGALLKLNRLEKAREHLARAVALDPANMEARHDLGVVLHHLGQIDEAIQQQQITITHEPQQLGAHSCLLFALCFSDTCTTSQYLVHAQQFAEQARRGAQRLTPPHPTQARHTEEARRRLRIGWVSGDLRKHVNMAFFKHILARLAEEPLDLVAFSNNPYDDAVTHQLRAAMTEWHDITPLSDQDAARLIHGCRIDVLVDLSGHTAHNRLPVFAWRPAPVQATWLGFAATTGLSEMDYLLADPVSVPPASSADFSERILYLPHTRLCMAPPASAERWPVSPLPVQRQGFITFGCFQQVGKINDRVLTAWQKILAAMPDARLRLQIRYLDLASVRGDLERRLAASGIAANRVSLHEGTSTDDYLAAHHEVDMILDTFPYPGGTTTAEALWMGVPTVTLLGASLLARQGASMLHTAGLSDWVAENEEAYVERALKFARDTEALAGLRQRLRAQATRSPLFDSHGFARDLAQALRAMHQQQQQQSVTES